MKDWHMEYYTKESYEEYLASGDIAVLVSVDPRTLSSSDQFVIAWEGGEMLVTVSKTNWGK